MTLILTRASKNYVLQVTDRLVTRSRQPFDELANKNIVYNARNAMVTLGYTGQAFVGDVATDQWIAEVLSRKVFDRHRKPPALSLGSRCYWLDLGLSLKSLKQELDTAVEKTFQPRERKQWIAGSFGLFVAGWQWKKRRARPVIAWLSKPRNSRNFDDVKYMPRYWHWDRSAKADHGRRDFKFFIGALPSENIAQSELKALCDRLNDRSPDEAEQLLVEAVRQVSARLPEVGRHCISILMMPPPKAHVRIRYIPSNGPARATISTSRGQTKTVPVAFSPWLVGPNMISAPSVLSGPTEVLFGPHIVVIEAPAMSHHLLSLFSSQRRPKPP